MSSAAPRSTPRRAGTHYEDLALAHLQRAGLTLVARNYSCRLGELDLIMQDGATLAFVEVRYRRSGDTHGFGDGIDSISAAKRSRLVRAASLFLAAQPRLARRACRFDVVAIAGPTGAESLTWCRNAFEAC
ncbi:YraN family protein [Dokdonella sp.]|uniref:YraN family protein n=1 Tax=Dokdonella sp. TaxID=2291710 RepID=UPI0031C6ACEF|nr:YraN family protein [Dokdonella sp.]